MKRQTLSPGKHGEKNAPVATPRVVGTIKVFCPLMTFFSEHGTGSQGLLAPASGLGNLREMMSFQMSCFFWMDYCLPKSPRTHPGTIFCLVVIF